MKRYDCTKIADFKHEKDRMCEMTVTDGCENCCFVHLIRLKDGVVRCDCLSDITEKEIDALQKWSDEHPEEARAEAFLERVPSCLKINNGIPCVCWANVAGITRCLFENSDHSCTECWNEPYNGEFEMEVPE
ncbi:MAG: hypothetical protein ACOX8R_02540 [Bacillota bacterium]